MSHLTRFERARLIGARALEIAQGAPVLVKTKAKDPIEIAKEELEDSVIPLRILRPGNAQEGK